MVNVPNGGRKKKLNATVANRATAAAYQKPQLADTSNTASKKVSATVVALACTARR